MSLILGVNMSGRDSSAALLRDGRIAFAVREERLNREKKTRRFPMLSIGAALAAAGARLQDVERVAVSWNPALNMERFNSAQSGVARYKPEHLYAVPNHLFMLLPPATSTLTEQRFHFPDQRSLDIAYVNHHVAHAADTFLLSPFEDAAILILDAYGEKDSVTFARGRGTSVTVLETIPFPHSLGSFYGTLTQFLGFTPDSDEWKVMGASPYGDPGRYYDALRRTIVLRDNGRFELDLSYFDFPTFTRPTMYGDKLTAALGPPRQPTEELEQRHFDIAAAVQQVTEEVAFHLLHHLHALTGLSNLCLGGGVAMNCVLNGKVSEHTPFRAVHVGSSADDGGTRWARRSTPARAPARCAGSTRCTITGDPGSPTPRSSPSCDGMASRTADPPTPAGRRRSRSSADASWAGSRDAWSSESARSAIAASWPTRGTPR
jgi:carbamoyltransferase